MSEPGTLAGQSLAAELRVGEEQVRLAEPDGRAALGAVMGLDAVRAQARLRFGPGRTCELVARLLDRVIVRAEQAGLSPARLILVAGDVEAGEDIVRVRRKAHGTADWIASPTCRVELTLRPAGLQASRAGSAPPPAGPAAPPPAGPAAPAVTGPAARPPGPAAPAAAAAMPAPRGGPGCCRTRGRRRSVTPCST